MGHFNADGTYDFTDASAGQSIATQQSSQMFKDFLSNQFYSGNVSIKPSNATPASPTWASPSYRAPGSSYTGIALLGALALGVLLLRRR